MKAGRKIAGVILISILALASLCSLDRDPRARMGALNANRTELYEKMAGDSGEVLAGGRTSQSLKLSDLFTRMNGEIVPALKAAEPPVRATVLYLPRHFSEAISLVVKQVLEPHLSGVWYQNPEHYHFSLLHASHHLEAVPATAHEVEQEIEAVKGVASACCPLSIQLERVILTPTGVLVSCWQVLEGTDPFFIRKQLKSALPRSPKSQLYDPVILHASLARIVPPMREDVTTAVLERMVSQLNKRLRNFQARIDELWYVEELDILALAVDGRMKRHRFPMKAKC